MVTYLDGKFAELSNRLDLQEKQVQHMDYKFTTKLESIKGSFVRREQEQQQPASSKKKGTHSRAAAGHLY